MKVKRVCRVCKKEFEVQPHELRQRPAQYCSLACSHKDLGRKLRKTVIWHCAACGVARRRTPCTATRYRLCRACDMKDRHRRLSGINIHMNRKARRAWLRMIKSPEHSAKMVEACTGMVQGGQSAKDNPRHMRAVHAIYQSPRLEQFRVDNIARFVRSHPHLFDPEDLKQKAWAKSPASYNCNATSGLSTLTRNRRSWKGWSLLRFVAPP